MPSGPPSVLLISIDTLRPDRLSCYGWTKGETPVIDGLASTGVLFETAVTAVPLTLPSHASLLTGRYPPSLGVRNNGAYRLAESAVTLAERFQEAGYRTGAFIGAYVLDHCFGLAQGFDVYDDEIPHEAKSGDGNTVAHWPEAERTADRVLARARQWITQTSPEPFFAWIHILEGRGAAAKRELEAALQIDPRFAAAHSNLARLYVFGPEPYRDPETAIRHAEMSLEYTSDPPPLDFLEVYAEALFAGGRKTEALEVNAHFLNIDPASEVYRQQRERFEGEDWTRGPEAGLAHR